MTIEIRKPELERLVEEEVLSGHFQSVDDLITEAPTVSVREERPPCARAPCPQEPRRVSSGIAVCRFRPEFGTPTGLRPAD